MNSVSPATTGSVEALFQPVQIGGLHLRSRVAMAPMGRHFAVEGQPSEAYAAYYARRARAGIALIQSQATPVPQSAAAHSPTYGVFDGEPALDVWRKTVAAVHAEGGRYFQQLFHVGACRMPGDRPDPDVPPVTPSGLHQPANGAGDAPLLLSAPATDSQIADVIAAFARGAATAKAIGCDGISLHAAHGYLLDQFFWPVLNRRTDRFGDDPRRLALEVLQACRQEVGPDFPVFMRISQWKQQDYAARLWETPNEIEAFLRPFVDLGVDLFDCSTRRFWTPEFEGSDLNLAGWVKKVTGAPTMTVGSVGLDRDLLDTTNDAPTPDNAGPAPNTGGMSNYARPAGLERLVEMLERGDFDLVAVGRALISNPEWPQHVREGRWESIRSFEKSHLATLE